MSKQAAGLLNDVRAVDDVLADCNVCHIVFMFQMYAREYPRIPEIRTRVREMVGKPYCDPIPLLNSKGLVSNDRLTQRGKEIVREMLARVMQENEGVHSIVARLMREGSSALPARCLCKDDRRSKEKLKTVLNGMQWLGLVEVGASFEKNFFVRPVALNTDLINRLKRPLTVPIC